MPGALVTGAGGGIGAAIARRLAARGLAVSVADIDADAASAVATEIGGQAWSTTLDVRDPQACRAAARETAERGGKLSVWVNNAGVARVGLAYEQELEVHRAHLDVNAIGTFNGTTAAIEVMRQAGSGHVINIVSLAGLAASPGLASYSASKHAALAFTLATLGDLRRTGEKRIQLSAVCPDGVWTPMIEPLVDNPDDALSFSGKMLMPDEVAEKAVGLLDRPRAVLAIPRWRGWFVRWFARHPDLATRITPLMMRDARRRQRRFKKRVEAGKWPPPSSRT